MTPESKAAWIIARDTMLSSELLKYNQTHHKNEQAKMVFSLSQISVLVLWMHSGPKYFYQSREAQDRRLARDYQTVTHRKKNNRALPDTGTAAGEVANSLTRYDEGTSDEARHDTKMSVKDIIANNQDLLAGWSVVAQDGKEGARCGECCQVLHIPTRGPAAERDPAQDEPLEENTQGR